MMAESIKGSTRFKFIQTSRRRMETPPDIHKTPAHRVEPNYVSLKEMAQYLGMSEHVAGVGEKRSLSLLSAGVEDSF
jgi:hypothetical protein